MRSPVMRAAIVLLAWVCFSWGLVPWLVGRFLPLPVSRFELHPFLCALAGDALSDAVPSIIPFVDSLAEGNPAEGFRIRPAGWALTAAIHVPLAVLVTWLGTVALGAAARRR